MDPTLADMMDPHWWTTSRMFWTAISVILVAWFAKFLLRD